MVFAATKHDRRAVRLGVGLALALLPMPALAQSAPPNIYARVAQRLSANPGIAATINKAPPEMAALANMVGDWHFEMTITALPDAPTIMGSSEVTSEFDGVWIHSLDTAASGTQTSGYIGYSALTKRWTNIAVDSMGNANTLTADGWQGNRLVFEGDVVELGEKAHLRETLTRVSDNEYRIETEELLGGGWKQLSTGHYTRISKG